MCPGDNSAPVGRERNHRGTPYRLNVPISPLKNRFVEVLTLISEHQYNDFYELNRTGRRAKWGHLPKSVTCASALWSKTRPGNLSASPWIGYLRKRYPQRPSATDRCSGRCWASSATGTICMSTAWTASPETSKTFSLS